MNHLAHALLAGADEDVVLGSLLGDFVRGPVDGSLPAGVARGLRLHRAIDVFTDAHPQVTALRQGIAAPFRRYAGILLDVWFDHLLARDFARWSPQPLAAFSTALLALLQRRRTELPAAMRGFVTYMQHNGLPAAYADAAMVSRALAGVGTRLSRPNPLHAALPVLQDQSDRLQAGFDAFFPELVAFAQERLQQPASAQDV